MTTIATKLIEAACISHGGTDQWLSTESISGTIENLSGWIPRHKGLGLRFRPPRRFDVCPHERRVTFHDHPASGLLTTFRGSAPGGAAIEVRSGEELVESTERYRQRFAGPRKLRFWSPADAAYFFGYSLLTYLCVPFLLPSCSILASDDHSVTVEFPRDFETHCRRQRFWFDRRGLIVRHDYTADVLGRWFTGAHHSSDFTTTHGLRVAQQRRVVPRIGSRELPGTALQAIIRFDG